MTTMQCRYWDSACTLDTPCERCAARVAEHMARHAGIMASEHDDDPIVETRSRWERSYAEVERRRPGI